MNRSVPKPPYRLAPVIEAVVDIQVDYGRSAPEVLRTVEKFAATLSSSFPTRQPLHDLEVSVADGAEGRGVSTRTRLIGQRLFGPGNARILLLRSEGFTYSHMQPYSNWTVFRSEALDLWRRFADSCQPQSVKRLAVRNINRLKLPSGRIELSDFLRFAPDLPDSIGDISGVVVKVDVPQLSIGPGAASTISLLSEQTPATDYQPMILDIDVFETGDWKPLDDSMWAQLDKIRAKKSEIFEACITDSTRRLFA